MVDANAVISGAPNGLRTWRLHELTVQTNPQFGFNDTTLDELDPEMVSLLTDRCYCADNVRSDAEISKGDLPHAEVNLQCAVAVHAQSFRDGRILATPLNKGKERSIDGFSASLWEIDLEGARVVQRFLGNTCAITDVASNASIIATASREGTARLFDPCSGSCTSILYSGEPVFAVTLCDREPFAFTGGCGESVLVWDLRKSSKSCLYELSTGNTMVKGLAWHGNTLIVAGDCSHIDRHGQPLDQDFNPVRPDTQTSLNGTSRSHQHWWPPRAKHDPDDFSEIFDCSSHAVFFWKFGGTVADVIRGVPAGEKACTIS